MPQSRWPTSILLRLTLLLVSLATCALSQGGTPAAPVTASASEIVEVLGSVEVASGPTEPWHPARIGEALQPGHRVRTRSRSRASIQLSDRSIVRMNQLTTLVIESPRQAPQKRRFLLNLGSLFFFNREKPTEVEFETPLATGAIRGTEFYLEADDGNLRLALFDGKVDLTADADQVSLQSGEEAQLRRGERFQKTALVDAMNLVQWALYYPGVLHVGDLNLERSETGPLEASLAAYRRGNLPEAFRQLPEGETGEAPAVLAFRAAVLLAGGRVDEATALIQRLPSEQSLSLALQEMMAAVLFHPWERTRPPELASEWVAHSYYLQSRSRLGEALDAARVAVRRAPDFGFGWVRVAELEFSFGRRRAALDALDRALKLAPENAQAEALRGFVWLDADRPRQALTGFARAIDLDGALGNAWLGRGLAELAIGHTEAGARWLQVAAAMEPQRSLFRSYLGKAFGQLGDDSHAEQELRLAMTLDPADPTPWLYSALRRFQHHQNNDAIRDLEQSLERNDNRSVFRSRLQLDRDLAVRSADLAALYESVRLPEASEHAATRAIEDDYANFSGHLFLARSLAVREDPARFDLRWETARHSELLVANLLAPAGAGNLSQNLPLQDHLQYFEQRPFGGNTLTEYHSTGDWSQSSTLFGSLDGVSYALDTDYRWNTGQGPNQDFEDFQLSFQGKAQLSPADGAYVQAGYFRGTGGELAQHYDPMEAARSLRTTQTQSPLLHFGYHHEWAPGSHTLFLASHLNDRLSLSNPDASAFFLRQSGGQWTGVSTVPYFAERRESDFSLSAVEVQQLWQSPQHRVIVGARYQNGSADTDATLDLWLTGRLSDQRVEPDLERISAYAYYQWNLWDPLWLTAGLSYDQLRFPLNVDIAPISGEESDRSLFGPKAALTYQPWQGGQLRFAYGRSLGGLYFDNSVRLEPAQLAGFTTSFRSLAPESAVGLVPGTEFDTLSLGFDQRLKRQTYFGFRAERLTSNGRRGVGAFTNGGPLPILDTPVTILQDLDFEERSLSAYLGQLLGRFWSVGARYRISEAQLNTAFPELPVAVPGVAALLQDERAVLGHLQLSAGFSHPTGWFATWQTDWYHQSNGGYAPELPGDEFWQHDIYAGYRFARRRAELRLGLLNLTGQDYRLNPLNLLETLPRDRTVVATFKFNF